MQTAKNSIYDADKVASTLKEAFEGTVERLAEYLRFPAISSEKSHHSDVGRLAEKIATDLTDLGLENSRVLALENALPIVAAEHLKAGKDKPTVLVYGHMDIQPVKGEPWKTNPHEATRIGERLYARGAADDMGGWVSHLAAIEAWLGVYGELPVNLKLIIEGEEEIGSPNLERYMDTFPEVFESDIMILTDCDNPSVDIPGLTVSLRGLSEFTLSCESIESDVHSGLWGNMVPDVSTALMQLIARLVNEDGRFEEAFVEVPKEWADRAWDVPINRNVIKKSARLVEGVEPVPDRGRPPAEWLWRQPALTVLTTTLPPPDQQKNALRAKAAAVLSVRIAPGQTEQDIQAILEELLLKDAPSGVKVTLEAHKGGAESWLYEPKGPAFEAADRAYEKVWGVPMLHIGVGGSIPFVALFGRKYGDLPLILNGVMDPETGAHGPNESLHLGVFEKAIKSNVYLYEELSRI